MAKVTRQYILKTVDGEEHGPVDQETLVRWAENQRITARCQIRSTLLARWEEAGKVSFLREIIAAQQETEEEEYEQTFLEKVKTRVTLRANVKKKLGGVHDVKLEDYTLAPIPLRLMAGISDLIIVGLFAVTVYLVMALLYSYGFDATACFYLWLVIVYVGVLMYYVWAISLKRQTLGHRIWGLLIVSSRGESVLLGRAYWFTLLALALGITTPFAMYVAPSGRALQDLISGVFIVKTRVVVKR